MKLVPYSNIPGQGAAVVLWTARDGGAYPCQQFTCTIHNGYPVCSFVVGECSIRSTRKVSIE
jgi:hypothetical protein